ncbi:unnamed protein product [marine sediment metagenome]|uniref:Uncharacterized protein n=1 Tax=marine sediment metagenome TaxID=412755 RepID=X1FS61_9ZZZZ
MVTWTTKDGRKHTQEITEAFKDILVNKEKEINQGGKMMDGAMQEQSSVARINDLLEEVDKEIHNLAHGIAEINIRLLPFIPPPKDEESKDLAKNLGAEIKTPRQEGWFVQTIVKLESLKNHLHEIDRGKIQKLKRATGLLEPESIESKGGESGR